MGEAVDRGKGYFPSGIDVYFVENVKKRRKMHRNLVRIPDKIVLPFFDGICYNRCCRCAWDMLSPAVYAVNRGYKGNDETFKKEA
ncbi:MAG: hypothetical protein ACI4JQ_01125 [Ruminococcus sp.]